jgi:hypothetical protein
MINSKETVILFGNPKDPDMINSINRVVIAGRKVQLQPAPSHDTGLGMCGKKICHCKGTCAMAFEGDKGATMGAGF